MTTESSSRSLIPSRIRQGWARLLPGLSVLAGGAFGSAARVGIGQLLPVVPGVFPSATLAVNLAGSFLLGLYLARRQQAAARRWLLQFWAFGVLGSFTTFSAFSLEVVQLVQANRAFLAGGYLTASIVGGLVLALVGQRIGRVPR